MMVFRWFRMAAFVAVGGMTLVGPQPLMARSAPDRFDTGRDGIGEPCVATRNWQTANGQVKLAAQQAFIITCRGVSSARVQGIVKPVIADDNSEARACSAAKSATMSGIGPVTVRRCYDNLIQAAVVEVRLSLGTSAYIGAAVPTALGPLEQTIRVVAGLGSPDPAVTSATIDLTDLEAPPPAPQQSSRGSEFVAEASLQQGISLLHRGLHVDASRVLNDALSRLTAMAPVVTRIELLLAAGLADSNISQFEAAQRHFRNAESLLAASPEIEGSAFLTSKSQTYRSLDLINRRQFVESIKLLDTAVKSIDPLRDPVFLGQLNQGSAAAGIASTLSVADSGQLGWLVIEAQKNWSRSIAQLALGQTQASAEALDRAIRYVNELRRSVAPSSILWLRSGIQRQQARIAAREGKFDLALKSFDCAVATLQGIVQPAGSACLFSGGQVRGSGAAATGPVVADTQFERASVAAQLSGASQATLLKEYASAVDTLASSGTANGSVPPALGNYLDLLIKASIEKPGTDIDEEYFRAMQTAGEPAIARDLARLQNVVTAEGSIGAKVRDRIELERTITRLRYEITELGAADPVKAKSLENERVVAEAALLTLNLELGENARYRALDDQPARIADIRAVLKPGEIYLKISALRANLYGIAITADKTFIYRLLATPPALDAIAGRVLRSARSRPSPDGARIDPFDVEAAFALFRAISGPAQTALASARAIVIDPSGPLRNIPLGILVTDADSVRRHKAQTGTASTVGIGDYSQISFLARKADVSTALSPRSFLIVRQKVAPSAAPRPFLGLGQNAPAPEVADEAGNRTIISAANCSISYRNWAMIANRNPPISAGELGLAATALGIGDAPSITGADFTDVALQKSSDAGQLRQFQILHFATHGIPETRYTDAASNCETNLPPSLITTIAAPGLSGADTSDGLLSFSEVARLNLDANLVVLAACETSGGTSNLVGRLAGQEESTPTLDGLVRAFISANARAVMATFWKVPAGAEGEALIETFYRSGRSTTIANSLRAAQVSLITQPQYSHPYYWGAYFIVGDGSKAMLSDNKTAGPDRRPEMPSR